MAVPRRARCPTCKTPVETEPGRRPADFPFCSERCRLVDLGRWLAEEYRIPVSDAVSADEEDDEP